MELLCVIAERKTAVYHVLHLRLFKNEKSMALKGDCGLTCTKDALKTHSFEGTCWREGLLFQMKAQICGRKERAPETSQLNGSKY